MFMFTLENSVIATEDLTRLLDPHIHRQLPPGSLNILLVSPSGFAHIYQ